MNTKICSKCLEEKDFSDFHKNKGGKFGLRSTCKLCHNKVTANWVINNPERQKIRVKRWRYDNLQKVIAYRKKYDKDRNFSRNIDDIFYTKKLLIDLRKRAKYRKLGFDLDFDFLYKLVIPMTCSITGVKLVRGVDAVNKKGLSPYTLSIDRVDSNKGYTKENCRAVCWWYNVSKQQWTDEELVPLIKAFVDKNYFKLW